MHVNAHLESPPFYSFKDNEVSSMHNKLAIAVVVLCVSAVSGQTRSEFAKKYGKTAVPYEVSEHILMTPEYTTDGHVCMVRLHPIPVAPNANDVSRRLPFEELRRVLKELIPPRSRGAKKEPFVTGAAGGGVDWMVYEYENVRFTFSASFRFGPDSWKRRGEYVFTIKPEDVLAQPPKPQDSTPSDDDFPSSKHSMTQLVTIRWNGRECAKQ